MGNLATSPGALRRRLRRHLRRAFAVVVFVGKLPVLTATAEGGSGRLVVVAAANTVVSLFYYLRWIAPMFAGEPEHNRPSARTSVPCRWSILPTTGG